MYKISHYIKLLKFRLSSVVVFSAMAGYMLGIDQFNISDFLLVILGGFLVTGSANGFNQIIEKEYDKLMQRTCERPLPQAELSVTSAVFFSLAIGFIGLFLLNLINPETSYFGFISKSCFFGFISMLLYVLAYTPLKRFSTVSIFVGAIPGAIPFLLGWVAATDDFGLSAGMLFGIQFLWQFPHFISIAWVQDQEYKKAGFKMLFGGKKNKYPATISIITSIFLLMLSIIPFYWHQADFKLNSYITFIFVFLLGIWFTSKSFMLYKLQNDISAKRLMFSSFIYLPLLQIIYIIDKFVF
jgi:protoheme IX farnesyltransferase